MGKADGLWQAKTGYRVHNPGNGYRQADVMANRDKNRLDMDPGAQNGADDFVALDQCAKGSFFIGGHGIMAA